MFAYFLQEGKFTTTEDLTEVWDETHYREKALGLGQPLTPLEKFRIRKRFIFVFQIEYNMVHVFMCFTKMIVC